MSKTNKYMPDPKTIAPGDFVLFKQPSRPTVMRPLEEVLGVRATDPETGRPAHIQCFTEPGEYTPTRNQNFCVDPYLARGILAGWTRRKPVALFGDPGTGKTEVNEQLFSALNADAVIVQLTEETESFDLLGEKGLDVKDGATCSAWIDGPVVEAFRKGLPVLFNELDYPRPGVITEANTFLRSDFLTLKANGGELVRRHPDTAFFGTLNTSGMGDQIGGFAGVQAQNAATMQRWRWIYVDYPTPEKEVEIVNKSVPELRMVDPSLADSLVKFAGFARELYRQKSTPLPFGVRSTIDAAEIAVDYGDVREGIRQTILNRISDDIQRDVIQTAFRDAFTMAW